MILFHHRAEIGLPSRSSQSKGWLPGMDSHHHSRLQRAMSYYLDDPAIVARQGNAPCSTD